MLYFCSSSFLSLPFSRLAFLVWIFFLVFIPSSPQLSIRPAVSGTTRSHKFTTGEDRPLVCRPGALRPEKQWFDKSAVPGGLPSADPRDHQLPEHCQPTTRANSCTDLWTGFSLRNNGSELLTMRQNNQFTVFEWIIPSEIYYFQAILKWMNPFTHILTTCTCCERSNLERNFFISTPEEFWGGMVPSRANFGVTFGDRTRVTSWARGRKR